MKKVPPEVTGMAVKQAMSMTPEQQEQLAKMGEKLFLSRRRRVEEPVNKDEEKKEEERKEKGQKSF